MLNKRAPSLPKMKMELLVLAAVLAAAAAAAVPTNKDDFESELNAVFRLLKNRAEQNSTFSSLLQSHFSSYDQDQKVSVNFDCDLPASPSTPQSAHAVRPGDINVIASLGDSITAGWGITASNPVQVLRNDRQLSWVTGGIKSLEEGVVTIANFLKTTNAGIAGASFGRSLPSDKAAGLNMAVGGKTADHIEQQVKNLIAKMKDPANGVDIDNDWKLISLMIGGNDLCRWCRDKDFFSPDSYVANIQRGLDVLYAELPKTIVVVSNIFDITPLPAFSDGLICDIIQTVVCPCATDLERLPDIQKGYVSKLKGLIDTKRYDRGRKDFTVVYMPHFDDTLPPMIPGTDEVDKTFFAPDCFHPGRKMHFAMATSLWNQLFEEEGKKRTKLDFQIGTNLRCPTKKKPYIRTNQN